MFIHGQTVYWLTHNASNNCHCSPKPRPNGDKDGAKHGTDTVKTDYEIGRGRARGGKGVEQRLVEEVSPGAGHLLGVKGSG